MTAPGPRRGSGGDGRDVGRLVGDAYATRVSLDTAARHLWSVDREARRLARRRRRQRLATTMASVVLLLAGVGTVAGSATAVPGETLYPVKDGLEHAELTMAVSDSAHARAHVRHSRARLAELREVADSNPELVPELAERFYQSLRRALDSGDTAVASEVAALRTEGAVLMDQLARDLRPSLARSLARVRGVPDSVAAVVPASAGRDDPARGGVGGGAGEATGGEDGSSAGEAVVAAPETAVADADPTASDGDSQTAVASPAPETSVADVAEPAPQTSTVETPPETSSQGSPASPGDDAGGDGSQGASSQPTPTSDGATEPTPTELEPTPTPTPSEPPTAQTPPETTTSQTGASVASDGGDDGGGRLAGVVRRRRQRG